METWCQMWTKKERHGLPLGLCRNTANEGGPKYPWTSQHKYGRPASSKKLIMVYTKESDCHKSEAQLNSQLNSSGKWPNTRLGSPLFDSTHLAAHICLSKQPTWKFVRHCRHTHPFTCVILQMIQVEYQVMVKSFFSKRYLFSYLPLSLKVVVSWGILLWPTLVVMHLDNLGYQVKVQSL
jgi:hypothetical protein